MRRAALLAGALLAGATLSVRAGSIEQLQQRMAAQFAAEDFAGMRESLLELRVLNPASVQTRYQLAAANALTGHAAEALAELHRLADMGLGYQPDREPAFKPLHADLDLQRIAGRMRDNTLPAGTATEAFTAGTRSFIPEGLAYDPGSGAFFLGSVHERRILRIAADGKAEVFVAPGESGLWSALGMAVDGRRGVLWVASSAFPEMENYDPIVSGRSALFGFALDDGHLVLRAETPADGRQHALGDVRVLSDGSVLVSDAAAGQLYRLDPERSALQPLLPDGALSSPQGFVELPNHRLVIADYSRGLFSWQPDTGRLQPLPAPDTVCTTGIDGLYRDGRNLIAIQNGTRPQRLMALRLTDDGSRIEGQQLLARSLDSFDEPTLGAVVGNELYFIANSHWGRFDGRHRLPDPLVLSPPLVMKLQLPPG